MPTSPTLQIKNLAAIKKYIKADVIKMLVRNSSFNFSMTGPNGKFVFPESELYFISITLSY